MILQPYDILNFRRPSRFSPLAPNVNVGNAQSRGGLKIEKLLNIAIRGRGRGVSVQYVRKGSEVKYVVGSMYWKDSPGSQSPIAFTTNLLCILFIILIMHLILDLHSNYSCFILWEGGRVANDAFWHGDYIVLPGVVNAKGKKLQI